MTRMLRRRDHQRAPRTTSASDGRRGSRCRDVVARAALRRCARRHASLAERARGLAAISVVVGDDRPLASGRAKRRRRGVGFRQVARDRRRRGRARREMS